MTDDPDSTLVNFVILAESTALAPEADIRASDNLLSLLVIEIFKF